MLFCISKKIGIIHRDIKPENILLVEKNSENLILKISDFGLSKILFNEFTFESFGSPVFAAPEIANRLKYRFEADVWSIGVVMYFLFYGKTPYEDDCEEKDLNNSSKSNSHKVRFISEEGIDLVFKCL